MRSPEVRAADRQVTIGGGLVVMARMAERSTRLTKRHSDVLTGLAVHEGGGISIKVDQTKADAGGRRDGKSDVRRRRRPARPARTRSGAMSANRKMSA
jgi:hypothetical protein